MKYRNTILSKKENEENINFLVNEKNLNTHFILSKSEILRIKKLEKPSHQLGYTLLEQDISKESNFSFKNI